MRIGDRYRTALVTGASGGLGEAFAAMLVGEGVVVWGTSRRPGPGIRPPVHPVCLELGERSSVEQAWELTERESGGIDLLVNNAGEGVFGGPVPPSAASWDGQIEVLFAGPARLSRLACAAMGRRGKGCLVNISSLCVDFPIPFMSGYNSAKAALAALSASLILDTRGAGVTIIDFRPGDFRTGFNRRMALSADIDRLSPACARVWAALERNMSAAPPPARAARDLRRAVLRNRSGVVRSGGFFQARLAPAAARLAPGRVVRFLLLRYFGLR